MLIVRMDLKPEDIAEVFLRPNVPEQILLRFHSRTIINGEVIELAITPEHWRKIASDVESFLADIL